MEDYHFYLAKAEESLNEEDAEELNLLHYKLSKLGKKKEKFMKKESEIKNRVAVFCLNLIEKTGRDEEEIHRTAYIISQFIWYKFSDELDDVMHMAKILELPKKRDKEFFGLWDNMREKLEEYINSEN